MHRQGKCSVKSSACRLAVGQPSTQDMEESMLQLVVSMAREQDRQFVHGPSE